MAVGSSIQWTDATWSPITGCTRVSVGCDHCYSARLTYRLEKMGQAKYSGLTVLNPKGDRHFNGVIKLHPGELETPLRWKKPRRIFVCSMSDLFHEGVPFEFIDKVFAVMALTPHHTYQILTKRPERMAEYMARTGKSIDFLEGPARGMGYTLKFELEGRTLGLVRWPIPGVWLGTSAEDQKRLDERVPHLLRCPAAVRFLSLEPLLGEINLEAQKFLSFPEPCYRTFREHHKDSSYETRDKAYETEVIAKCPLYHDGCRCIGISWAIVGGESGPGARPCNVEWIRSIVRQCKAAGVACFVKQLGLWITGSHEFEGWQGSIDRWRLRDEKGGESTWHRPVLRSDYCPMLYDERPQNAVAWGLGDPKGGDMTEWPADLRIREMPTGRAVTA